MPAASPDAPPVTTADLAAFDQALRPYQQALVSDACAFVEVVLNDVPNDAPATQRRRLYSCPTGTGKTHAQLAILKILRASGVDAWAFTPSIDVLRGYLERCGVPRNVLDSASEERLANMGEDIYCTTPTRAQNRILAAVRGVPEVVLYDEVHHAIENNDVSGTLFALGALTVWLGFTATPYRATPRATAELEAAWPDQVDVLTIPEAVAAGYWALPTFEVVGLVDDDEVKVAGGDFQSKAAGTLVGSRITAIAELVQARLFADVAREPAPGSEVAPVGGLAWVPTAITVPNTEAAGLLVEALDRLGIPARRVGQDTSARDRGLAYAECRSGKGVLVSVRVLAEGVDLPWLRRLVDARPTMSPVSWLQQIGRITRPGPVRPEYICVCRNLERHAYLLQGMAPRRAVSDAQAAFPNPSKRSGSRSIGLEALTKFKAIDLPLADGVRGSMYALYATENATGVITEWVALLDPTSERSLTARREVAPATDGSRGYGRWVAAPLPMDLAGHATSGFRGEISEKQRLWWERQATRFGLDVEAVRGNRKLAQRAFAALPVLRDLGQTMRATPVGGDA